MPLPDRVSDAVRRLNPDLFGPAYGAPTPKVQVESESSGPRIRQKQGPKLNKLETALLHHLRGIHPGAEVEPHAVKLRIANGSTYEPDFLVQFHDGARPLIYEAKGPWIDGDAIVKLKVAAARHRWADFHLASREGRGGPWKLERVLP